MSTVCTVTFIDGGFLDRIECRDDLQKIPALYVLDDILQFLLL